MNALSYAMTFALRSMRIKLMKLMSIAKYIDGRQLGWVVLLGAIGANGPC